MGEKGVKFPVGEVVEKKVGQDEVGMGRRL